VIISGLQGANVLIDMTESWIVKPHSNVCILLQRKTCCPAIRNVVNTVSVATHSSAVESCIIPFFPEHPVSSDWMRKVYFFFLKILFIWHREREWGREGEGQADSTFHTEHRAWHWAPSHNPEIMISAQIKSWGHNKLRHPHAPEWGKFIKVGPFWPEDEQP